MNPFLRLNRGSIEEQRGAAERQFEAARVRFVLKKCGLPKKAERELQELHRERLGSVGLNFALFNEIYPTFPVVLGTSRLAGAELHRDPRAILPMWFSKFQDVPFYPPFEALESAVKGHASGRPIGLVFPRKGFAQGLIIHTEGLDEYWLHGGCYVYRGGTKNRRVDLFVRPFASLIEAIHNRGRGWDPASG